mmetsp:Transcript_23394/g.68871  ORF Transcript_23394/g.68871 Transcript_23394/m.68871 type:complete len:210 (-) Transcript_23394:81-710(-)
MALFTAAAAALPTCSSVSPGAGTTGSGRSSSAPSSADGTTKTRQQLSRARYLSFQGRYAVSTRQKRMCRKPASRSICAVQKSWKSSPAPKLATTRGQLAFGGKRRAASSTSTWQARTRRCGYLKRQNSQRSPSHSRSACTGFSKSQSRKSAQARPRTSTSFCLYSACSRCSEGSSGPAGRCCRRCTSTSLACRSSACVMFFCSATLMPR